MKVRTVSQHGAIALLGLFVALSGCARKTAQEEGAELAGRKLDLATGVGDALKAKGGVAGETLVTGVGTVLKGVERGVLKSGRDVTAAPR